MYHADSLIYCCALFEIGVLGVPTWIMNVIVHETVSRVGFVKVMFADSNSHYDAASSACAYSYRFIQFNP